MSESVLLSGIAGFFAISFLLLCSAYSCRGKRGAKSLGKFPAHC